MARQRETAAAATVVAPARALFFADFDMQRATLKTRGGGGRTFQGPVPVFLLHINVTHG